MPFPLTRIMDLSGCPFHPRRWRQEMPHMICEPCIGVKDRSCQEVCPVECIYDAGEQLYIHPDECIDCGACVPACPVNAIYPEEDVPEQWKVYIEKNRTWAQTLPNVHVLEGGQ